jgi:hypothetical protein
MSSSVSLFFTNLLYGRLGEIRDRSFLSSLFF